MPATSDLQPPDDATSSANGVLRAFYAMADSAGLEMTSAGAASVSSQPAPPAAGERRPSLMGGVEFTEEELVARGGERIRIVPLSMRWVVAAGAEARAIHRADGDRHLALRTAGLLPGVLQHPDQSRP